MLNGAALVAFVPTTDLERSHAFYGSRLGLPLIESSAFVNVYDANGTTLRVTRVENVAEVPYTMLGWGVDEIVTTVGELVERGIQCKRYPNMEQDRLGIWTAPDGARVAWFVDPDGNTLSLQQQT